MPRSEAKVLKAQVVLDWTDDDIDGSRRRQRLESESVQTLKMRLE